MAASAGIENEAMDNAIADKASGLVEN